ncbi:cytochrome P450 2U1-like [Diadema antillarum]|uniref:cytochrome P450 2U1-like n=1 Tax=Diadema antillarum TaxID=105358 RepID=UPI003A83D417
MELYFLCDLRYVLMSTVAVLFTSCLVSVLGGRKRNYPPGPPVWPLLGSLPYLARLRLPHLQMLTKLPEDYGDIVYLRILGFDIVVLSEYSVIKEAFHRADFSARPVPVYSTVAGRRNFGLVTSSGEVSREQRQIAHSFFRTFGVGKTRFEEDIRAETSHLLEEFQRTEGKTFNPKQIVNNAVSNIICAVVFGSRHEYTDPDFNALQDAVNSNLKISKSGGLFFFLEKLARIPRTPGYHIRQNVSSIIAQLRKFLADHRKDHIPNNPRDMIDMYIDKIAENEKNGSSLSYDETNLLFTLADIFSGGTETTTTVLRWLLLFMVTNPEVQKKVQDEIDSVIGRERQTTFADRPKLPYTEATILEAQRASFPIPLGVPHRYTGKGMCKFHGYNIPEGALILANNWRVSRDPRLWTDPEEFKPERFLDVNGNCVKPDEMIPFSIGKRVCIGESLAKMELFIVFTSLMQRFSFQKPDGVSSYSTGGDLGAVFEPEPYTLCAMPRD